MNYSALKQKGCVPNGSNQMPSHSNDLNISTHPNNLTLLQFSSKSEFCFHSFISFMHKSSQESE